MLHPLALLPCALLVGMLLCLFVTCYRDGDLPDSEHVRRLDALRAWWGMMRG